MARRYCTPDSAYGCNHHEEHRRAALLGWARRHGEERQYARMLDEERILSRVYGEQVKQPHRHKSHPGETRFKIGEQWFSVPDAEYRDLLRAGKLIERDERQAARREEQRLKRERASAPVREAANRLLELRSHDAFARMGEEDQSQFYSEARSTLKKMRIRPSRQTKRQIVSLGRRKGKEIRAEKLLPVDYEEYTSLPRDLRNARRGVSVDDAIQQLQDEGFLPKNDSTFYHSDFYEWVEKMEANRDAIRAGQAQRRAEIRQAERELRKLRSQRRTAKEQAA